MTQHPSGVVGWDPVQRATEPTTEAPEIVRLTADTALFGRGTEGHLYVLMIERGWDPYAGLMALPGGHVDAGEHTEDAAHRELREETGLDIGRLGYVGTYAEAGRDPRGRYVTFAYTAMLDHTPAPTAGDDAKSARWVLVDEALATGTTLAFDHARIIHDALRVAL